MVITPCSSLQIRLFESACKDYGSGSGNLQTLYPVQRDNNIFLEKILHCMLNACDWWFVNIWECGIGALDLYIYLKLHMNLLLVWFHDTSPILQTMAVLYFPMPGPPPSASVVMITSFCQDKDVSSRYSVSCSHFLPEICYWLILTTTNRRSEEIVGKAY